MKNILKSLFVIFLSANVYAAPLWRVRSSTTDTTTAELSGTLMIYDSTSAVVPSFEVRGGSITRVRSISGVVTLEGAQVISGTKTFTGHTIFNNNIGVFTSSPIARLHLATDGVILSQGSLLSGWTEPNLGAGTRLLWYPRKGALRAGYVSGARWNHLNIGDYSVAFGNDSIASGIFSAVGGGFYNEASAANATVSGGWINTANAAHATVSGGALNTASGYAAKVSGGESNMAGGRHSWAGGKNMQLTDAADQSFVFGHSNTPFSIFSPNAFLIDPNNWGYRVSIGTSALTHRLSVAGDIFAATNITASAFFGDGSALIGVVDNAVRLSTGIINTDLQSSKTSIAISTAGLKTDLISVGVATGTLRTDLTAIAISTGTLVRRTGDTMTGNLSVIGSITATSFHGDGSALTGVTSIDSAVRASTGIINTDLQSSKVSIGLSTDTLRTDLNNVNADLQGSKVAIGASTSTLRTDLTAVALSTGTLVKRSGDTMTGTLNAPNIIASTITANAFFGDTIAYSTHSRQLINAEYFFKNSPQIVSLIVSTIPITATDNTVFIEFGLGTFRSTVTFATAGTYTLEFGINSLSTTANDTGFNFRIDMSTVPTFATFRTIGIGGSVVNSAVVNSSHYSKLFLPISVNSVGAPVFFRVMWRISMNATVSNFALAGEPIRFLKITRQPNVPVIFK